MVLILILCGVPSPPPDKLEPFQVAGLTHFNYMHESVVNYISKVKNSNVTGGCWGTAAPPLRWCKLPVPLSKETIHNILVFYCPAWHHMCCVCMLHVFHTTFLVGDIYHRSVFDVIFLLQRWTWRRSATSWMQPARTMFLSCASCCAMAFPRTLLTMTVGRGSWLLAQKATRYYLPHHPYHLTYHHLAYSLFIHLASSLFICDITLISSWCPDIHPIASRMHSHKHTRPNVRAARLERTTRTHVYTHACICKSTHTHTYTQIYRKGMRLDSPATHKSTYCFGQTWRYPYDINIFLSFLPMYWIYLMLTTITIILPEAWVKGREIQPGLR